MGSQSSRFTSNLPIQLKFQLNLCIFNNYYSGMRLYKFEFSLFAQEFDNPYRMTQIFHRITHRLI